MAIKINYPIVIKSSTRVGPIANSGPVAPPVDTVSLLAYYDVSSYSGGSTLSDSSGNNLHATLVNSPTYSAQNKSLTFNGSNQYANVPHSSLLNLGPSWTIVAVTRFLRFSGSNSIFSTFHNTGSALLGYSLGLDYLDANSYCLNINNLRSYLGTGQFSNHIKKSNANTITDSSWRMVSAVATNATTNTTINFYNNTTNIGSGTWCAGYTSGATYYSNSTSSIRIASTNAAGYKVDYANIELGRLMIYTKELTAAQISDLYNTMKFSYSI